MNWEKENLLLCGLRIHWYCCHYLLCFPGSEFFSCQNCEAVAGCSSGLDPLAPGDQDKPYKCQLCRSAFRYKGNLASHRTVHTGRGGAGRRGPWTSCPQVS